MALFRRGASRRGEPALVAVARLAREALATRGVETVVEGADDVETAVLRAADGSVLPLYNIVRTCEDEPRRAWAGLVGEHVDRVIAGLRAAEPEDLPVDELLTRIRTRLFSSADVDCPRPGDLSYARPFAEGLVTALCVDYPHTVTTISAEDLAKLPVPVEELFAQGQRNTDAEPVDENAALSVRVRILTGESLFVAARAGNFRALLPEVGPADQGLLFSVPDRHTILYTVFDGVESIASVNALLRFTATFVNDPEMFHPGGVLSGDVYYWAPDGRVERVGGLADDGHGLELRVTGAFAEVFPAETR
ncbi:hypothetical protein [Isoptericola sp. NPDC057191]|uniref:hypothetical protein n=1 Tax=Isoptericola sp. NPDC057191 TaxID=3346041 RepID=UPI003638B596